MSHAPRRKKPVSASSRRMQRGFVQTGGILGSQIRKTSEKRGFAESRLLTHWAEIAGEAVAKIARPVKVAYNRQGMGATLTLLCTGANAPILQMQLTQIVERVNACYGYAAISRIQITQTAPSGFAEPATEFEHAPQNIPLTSAEQENLKTTVADVTDDGLRQALANLGEKILTKPKNNK